MLFPPNASDLLQRIPLSARVVLDVGCGDATWPAVFRSMNPRARLLGIAFDSSSAALAAPHMDQVITTDANAETQGLDLPDGIDCIIYDNSLQYLRDPWAVIRRHADLLGPDGIMLFRVPNIEYWRFADRLLRGTRQRDEVTDPVWQHGFDLDSMREHLVAAGLHICDTTMMRPTGEQPDREAETEAATAFAAGLSGLGIDPETYLKRAAASHMIWRARKQPLQRLVLSGNMLDPVGGVSHVRVVYPMEAIGTDPTIIARVTDQVTLGPKDDGVARIFVLHRPALVDERGHETLRRLTAAGFLIVTEFDDLPDHFDMMRKGGALSFYGAHAVQTSTTAMATAIRCVSCRRFEISSTYRRRHCFSAP
jgi:SAM-dependent methyltransferase